MGANYSYYGDPEQLVSERAHIRGAQTAPEFMFTALGTFLHNACLIAKINRFRTAHLLLQDGQAA